MQSESGKMAKDEVSLNLNDFQRKPGVSTTNTTNMSVMEHWTDREEHGTTGHNQNGHNRESTTVSSHHNQPTPANRKTTTAFSCP